MGNDNQVQRKAVLRRRRKVGTRATILDNRLLPLIGDDGRRVAHVRGFTKIGGKGNFTDYSDRQRLPV